MHTRSDRPAPRARRRSAQLASPVRLDTMSEKNSTSRKFRALRHNLFGRRAVWTMRSRTVRTQDLIDKAILQAQGSRVHSDEVMALQSKFSESGVHVLAFHNLSVFHGGLESQIGAANPNLTLAMRIEHCMSAE